MLVRSFLPCLAFSVAFIRLTISNISYLYIYRHFTPIIIKIKIKETAEKKDSLLVYKVSIIEELG